MSNSMLSKTCIGSPIAIHNLCLVSLISLKLAQSWLSVGRGRLSLSRSARSFKNDVCLRIKLNTRCRSRRCQVAVFLPPRGQVKSICSCRRGKPIQIYSYHHGEPHASSHHGEPIINQLKGVSRLQGVSHIVQFNQSQAQSISQSVNSNRSARSRVSYGFSARVYSIPLNSGCQSMYPTFQGHLQ